MYGTFMRAEALPTGRNVYRHISRHAKLFKCSLQFTHQTATTLRHWTCKKNQLRLAGPQNVMNAYVRHNGKAGQQGTLHSSTIISYPGRRLLKPGYRKTGLILHSAGVWNLVSDIKGGTQTEGVWEQGVEENIWTEERWSGRRMVKTT
jgi:hypothetical protein